MVEHLTFNQVVRGSNPRTLSEIRKPRKMLPRLFFYFSYIMRLPMRQRKLRSTEQFAGIIVVAFAPNIINTEINKKPGIDHRLRKEEMYIKKHFCFDVYNITVKCEEYVLII